ncbi:sulfotransferase domain-containing protein [Alteromonas ponticola]|uniref:Sulfotransferase domain-containing protein n=1 Tax=Alteromonas aquimaris TaxID=2998417 RepID=A0ABT3P4B2_9ALTE|nr:sulfotransferase domain-containing protein [Alteromonas aquimaris]MCW8107616.1 sulfotransferase domain-containing protein [Alteromonas aquimaris]
MSKRIVVSFPKSGRSWLRYAIELTGKASDIVFCHDEFEYNDATKPALNFNSDIRQKRYGGESGKLVYVDRDTRDTIVSLYNQVTGRFNDIFNYPDNISAFIRDEYFGVDNLIKFQKMWRNLAVQNHWLVVRYEEMHNDFEEVLTQVCEYFEINIDHERIQEISEQASFTNMRQLELSGNSNRPWLTPRNNYSKVRKGIVGGYTSELGLNDIKYIENRMKHFGLRKNIADSN